MSRVDLFLPACYRFLHTLGPLVGESQCLSHSSTILWERFLQTSFALSHCLPLPAILKLDNFTSPGPIKARRMPISSSRPQRTMDRPGQNPCVLMTILCRMVPISSSHR